MSSKYSTIGRIMAPQVKRFNDCEEMIQKFKMIASSEASTDLARSSIMFERDLTEFADYSMEWNKVSTKPFSNELSRIQQYTMSSIYLTIASIFAGTPGEVPIWGHPQEKTITRLQGVIPPKYQGFNFGRGMRWGPKPEIHFPLPNPPHASSFCGYTRWGPLIRGGHRKGKFSGGMRWGHLQVEQPWFYLRKIKL